MPDPWRLCVYDSQQLAWTADVFGAALLGRQSQSEPGPYHAAQEGERTRVVIARLDETLVPRRFVLVEPVDGATAKLSNVSERHEIHLADGMVLNPKTSRTLGLPIVLSLGGKTVRIQPAEAAQFHSLDEATRPPGAPPVAPVFASLQPASGEAINTESMLRWFRATQEVLQSAASSSDFFDRAALALTQLVGLDTGRVLLWNHDDWSTRALQQAPKAAVANRPPSRTILDRVRKIARSFGKVPLRQMRFRSVWRGCKRWWRRRF